MMRKMGAASRWLWKGCVDGGHTAGPHKGCTVLIQNRPSSVPSFKINPNEGLVV